MKESVVIDFKELLKDYPKDLEYLKDIEPFTIEEPSMLYKNEIAEIVKCIQPIIVGMQLINNKTETLVIEDFAQLINDSIDVLEIEPTSELEYIRFQKNIFTIVKKQVKKQDVNDFTKTYISTIFGTEQDKISMIGYDILGKHIIRSFFLVSSVYHYLESKVTKTYTTSLKFRDIKNAAKLKIEDNISQSQGTL